MEFILILFFHFLGDYVFQPNWMDDNKSSNMIVLILHTLIYSLTLYIMFPVLILIVQMFSGLPMVEFLSSYDLTAMNNWDFDVFLYLFIGHSLIDIWTHKLSKHLDNRHIKTGDWKWRHLSRSVLGLDELLHIIHLYLIYSIVFL